MIRLYDYQTDIISEVKEHMRDGKTRICIQSPTGSGKTVIFSHIVSQMKRNNKRALIITDRVELLFETGGTLEQFGLKPFHILAGQMVEPPRQFQVYVAMSQTLRRRINKWPNFFKSFDVVILDECHKQEFNPYFEQNAFPESTYILGFSATPMRTGKQRQLSEDYEMLIEGLQVPELIKRKKLVKDRYFGVEQHADMAGVRLNSFGDYQESGMFERFNKRELYEGAVNNWKKLTPDTITLVFCVNIQHTIETCKAFNEAGIKAKFLTSPVSVPRPPERQKEFNHVFNTEPDTDEKFNAKKVKYDQKLKEYNNWREAYSEFSGDRDVVLRQWKRGDFKVLINAGILTTGFNYQAIETIVINRATTSVPLWLQMLGRGSRTYPGKNYFNILDFGDNAKNLGYYNQERRWELHHEQSKGGGAPPVKECGTMTSKPKTDKNNNAGCGSYVFASAKICDYCGYIFEQEKEAKFAELIEIDYSKPVSFERNFFDELEKEAESRGYKFGWVLNRIIAEKGEQGLKDYGQSRNYQSGWFWQTKRRYQRAIDAYNKKHAKEHVAS